MLFFITLSIPLCNAFNQELIQAIENDDSIKAMSLINKDTIMSKNYFGETPLHIAARRGQSDLARVLIKSGSDLNSIDNQSQTPLHRAAEYGYCQVVKMLAQAGANLTMQDNTGETALHKAAYNNQGGASKILIKAGSYIDAPNKYYDTPLHYAAKMGNTHIIKLLALYGSNLNAKNIQAQTPLELAHFYHDAIKVLLEHNTILYNDLTNYSIFSLENILDNTQFYNKRCMEEFCNKYSSSLSEETKEILAKRLLIQNKQELAILLVSKDLNLKNKLIQEDFFTIKLLPSLAAYKIQENLYQIYQLQKLSDISIVSHES